MENWRKGVMNRDKRMLKIFKEIIVDKQIYDFIRKIMESDIVKNYYKTPVLYTFNDIVDQKLVFEKINELDNSYKLEVIDKSLEEKYKYFMNNIFNESFFKEYIILCELGKNVGGLTNKTMRIFINYLCGEPEYFYYFCDKFYEETQEKDLKKVSIFI